MKQQKTDFFSWNFLLLKKKGYQKRRSRAFISHCFLKTHCLPPTYLSGATNEKKVEVMEEEEKRKQCKEYEEYETKPNS